MQKFDVSSETLQYLYTDTLIAIPLHGPFLEHPELGETVRIVVSHGNEVIIGRHCTVKSISVNIVDSQRCYYANVTMKD